MSELELYHHGIKGQKWGVRRYQNKDGSLTDVGKDRYVRKRDVKQARDEMKVARHTPEYKAAKIKYDMTKRSYKSLVKEYTKEINAGQSFVYKMFGSVTGINKALAKAYIEVESDPQ